MSHWGQRWTPEQLDAFRQKLKRDPTKLYGYAGDANANDSRIPTLTDEVKPKKYRNETSGRYASKREARRAVDLKLLVQAGEITDLREQVPFLLIPAQRDAKGRVLERSVKYIADFVYTRRLTSSTVVEDCKSTPTKTPAYILKRKLMLFIHGIKVIEV